MAKKEIYGYEMRFGIYPFSVCFCVIDCLFFFITLSVLFHFSIQAYDLCYTYVSYISQFGVCSFDVIVYREYHPYACWRWMSKGTDQ